MSVEIADITPSAPQSTDRLLMRRGTVTKSLELLDGPTPETLSTVLAELAALKNDYASLLAAVNARGAGIQSILPSGRWLDNQFSAGSAGTLAGSAGQLRVYPVMHNIDVAIDMLAIQIAGGSGVTGAEGRLCVYEANSAGEPGALLVNGDSQAMATINTTIEQACDIVLRAGKLYFAGVHVSSTQTIRTNASIPPSLGLSSNGATHSTVGYTRTVTYANGLPDPFGTPSVLQANAATWRVAMRVK
jgi:hypothetical protein